jgi:hypothetical protein
MHATWLMGALGFLYRMIVREHTLVQFACMLRGALSLSRLLCRTDCTHVRRLTLFNNSACAPHVHACQNRMQSLGIWHMRICKTP